MIRDFTGAVAASLAKLGVTALVLLFLGGLWLVAALAFVSLVIYLADALRELAGRGRHAEH